MKLKTFIKAILLGALAFMFTIGIMVLLNGCEP